jgi:hypothetical protein
VRRALPTRITRVGSDGFRLFLGRGWKLLEADVPRIVSLMKTAEDALGYHLING